MCEFEAGLPATDSARPSGHEHRHLDACRNAVRRGDEETEAGAVGHAGGTSTLTWCGREHSPDPEHPAHRSAHVSPRPPQCRHVWRNGTSSGTVAPANAWRGERLIADLCAAPRPIVAQESLAHALHDGVNRRKVDRDLIVEDAALRRRRGRRVQRRGLVVQRSSKVSHTCSSARVPVRVRATLEVVKAPGWCYDRAFSCRDEEHYEPAPQQCPHLPGLRRDSATDGP